MLGLPFWHQKAVCPEGHESVGLLIFECAVSLPPKKAASTAAWSVKSNDVDA